MACMLLSFYRGKCNKYHWIHVYLCIYHIGLLKRQAYGSLGSAASAAAGKQPSCREILLIFAEGVFKLLKHAFF